MKSAREVKISFTCTTLKPPVVSNTGCGMLSLSKEFVEENSDWKDPRHMSCNMYPVREPQDYTQSLRPFAPFTSTCTSTSLRASKVDLVVKGPVFPTISISMWTKPMMLKIARWETKMSAWTRLFQWLPPGAIHARLQGATHVHTSINQAAAAPGS